MRLTTTTATYATTATAVAFAVPAVGAVVRYANWFTATAANAPMAVKHSHKRTTRRVLNALM